MENKFRQGSYSFDPWLTGNDLYADCQELTDTKAVAKYVQEYADCQTEEVKPNLKLANKTIKQLQTEVQQWATEKGWYDQPVPFPEMCALMHSEISEALEEFRAGHSPSEEYSGAVGPEGLPKPEGVPSELADLFIRLLDYTSRHGIDLEAAYETKMAYNRTRPYRHGGKKA